MVKLPNFAEAECRSFAEAANPHQWVLTADSLHEQAVALHSRRLTGGKLVRRGVGEPTVAVDNTNKATFLLGALALENAIKAFLVYEHPEWVSDGYLHKEICSHKLVQLSEQSSLIPYLSRDKGVLAAFEEGNESWMRYPCGRRANGVEPEKAMTGKLWAGYTRVMSGYGTKLMRLLRAGWSGPHGSGGGYWDMDGEWLGGRAPPQKP
jgi:hypothetical protein